LCTELGNQTGGPAAGGASPAVPDPEAPLVPPPTNMF
jgi:hypothetical protein